MNIHHFKNFMDWSFETLWYYLVVLFRFISHYFSVPLSVCHSVSLSFSLCVCACLCIFICVSFHQGHAHACRGQKIISVLLGLEQLPVVTIILEFLKPNSCSLKDEKCFNYWATTSAHDHFEQGMNVSSFETNTNSLLWEITVYKVF